MQIAKSSRKRRSAIEHEFDTKRSFRRQALEERSIMEDTFRKNHSILEKVILYDLEIYNPLSMNFNNITKWQNLVYLNLSNNKISYLPNELGIFPFLEELNLSQNRLGISFQHKHIQHKWLDQTAIKNNLYSLNISDNSITELPYNIGKLKALRTLKLHKNMLTYLPHSMAHLRNLRLLNVSHNPLLYLPKEFFSLQLEFLILVNPSCTVYRNQIKRDYIRYASIVEVSFAILKRHRIPYKDFLPNILCKDLNTIRRCFNCKQYCTTYYAHWISSQSCLSCICQLSVMGSSNDSKNQQVLLDYIACYPTCRQ